MANKKKVKKPACGVCGIDLTPDDGKKAVMCRTCKAKQNGDAFPCPECGGTGTLPSPIPDTMPGVCPQCDGKPFIWEDNTDGGDADITGTGDGSGSITGDSVGPDF